MASTARECRFWRASGDSERRGVFVPEAVVRQLVRVAAIVGGHQDLNLLQEAVCHLNLRVSEVLIPCILDCLPELLQRGNPAFGGPPMHARLKHAPDHQIEHIEVRRARRLLLALDVPICSIPGKVFFVPSLLMRWGIVISLVLWWWSIYIYIYTCIYVYIYIYIYIYIYT